MDSSFGAPHYQVKPPKSFDTLSQTTNMGGLLRNIDLPCTFHPQEQFSNYCLENKCYQPLCAQCIQEHLLMHKKHGYSDLGIKSLRGVRKQCIGKLGPLIEQLVRRLSLLEAPIPPQQQIQVLESKLESVRQRAHELVQAEFARLKDSLRATLSESINYFKSMADIHSKLEDLIQQLRQNYSTLLEGSKKGFTIPDCIKRTLTLDQEALLDTFQKEGTAYELRRAKAELQVIFQQDMFRQILAQSIQIVAPQSLNVSKISTKSAFQPTKSRLAKFDGGSQDIVVEDIFPRMTTSRGKSRQLHFFETGSDKLHIISIDGRKGYEKVVKIGQFIVPSFHASLLTENGQFIYLSGGIVQLNQGYKSPLLIRYSMKTQTCKKDFAKVKPRSSHSLCEDSKGDIYILGGYGPSQLSGGDPSYQMTVERVNPRSGRVEIETPSNWGGSNISILCNGLIIKACQEGIQVYNTKNRQWTIAQVKSKPRSQYNYFKNTGFACLNSTDILIFGGYYSDSTSSDLCFLWKFSGVERPKVQISGLSCRLPVAQGFENCCPIVDDDGIWILQNVQDQKQSCLEGQRRMLRFSLSQKSWSVAQLIQE